MFETVIFCGVFGRIATSVGTRCLTSIVKNAILHTYQLHSKEHNMTNIDTMRERIAENTYDLDRNSLGFDTCYIFWNQDMTEWIIIHQLPTGHRTAGDWDNLERHLGAVPDQEIEAWYNEHIADEYEEAAA
jgi:hypothetical protein